MTQFRPIALCNVVAKVVAKVLATRLKSIFSSDISDSHSAFVPHRLITHNVLLSFEAHHFIKNQRQGKKGFMSIKLDMLKAYDQSEWSFLRAMLIKLNFGEKWVKIIMDYVISVSYSDACLKGTIKGIKMGPTLEPLSHLLFADDTLLLGDATVEEASSFKEILKQYEEWYGQKVECPEIFYCLCNAPSRLTGSVRY
ncbi:hypothetical protein LIER_03259 [Lithospermum erythrorhizon]|uniref:Reverse transcriptase domain-containing protein n=1 Tax=Lithospermum erythrorhizon TaxID=34254 RepID=A0AAV3NT99_LITER